MADKLISLSTFKRALNSLKSKFLPTSGGEVGALTLTDGLKVNKGNVVINNRYGGIYGINSANKPIPILSNVYEATGVGNSTTNLTLHSKVAPKWNDNGKSHNLVTSYNGGIEETLSSIRLINSGTIYGTPGGDVAENEMILLQSYYGQTQLGNDKCQTLIDSLARPKVRFNNTNYEMAITEDIPEICAIAGYISNYNGKADKTVSYPVGFTKDNCVVISAMCFHCSSSSTAPTYYRTTNDVLYETRIDVQLSSTSIDIITDFTKALAISANNNTVLRYKIVLMKI